MLYTYRYGKNLEKYKSESGSGLKNTPNACKGDANKSSVKPSK